jgi:hypothetical protein
VNDSRQDDSENDPEDLDENASDVDELATKKLLEAVRLEIEALRAMLGLSSPPSPPLPLNPDHNPTEDDL